MSKAGASTSDQTLLKILHMLPIWLLVFANANNPRNEKADHFCLIACQTFVGYLILKGISLKVNVIARLEIELA